jgi:hypothetical protein
MSAYECMSVTDVAASVCAVLLIMHDLSYKCANSTVRTRESELYYLCTTLI